MPCKHNSFLNYEYEDTNLERLETDQALLRIKESVKKLNADTNAALNSEVETLTNSISTLSEYTQQQLETSVNEITAQLNADSASVNGRINSTVTTLNETISSEVSKVNDRIDNIIANSVETEGNSELIDIRTGVNATIYSSAGSSVREQMRSLKNQTDSIFQKFYHVYNLLDVGYTINNVNFQYGDAANGSGRIVPGTKKIVIFPVVPGTVYYFTQLSSIYHNIALYNIDMGFISTLYNYHDSHGNWNTEWSIPETCHYIGVVIDDEYKDTAYFGLRSNYSKWSDGYKYDTDNIQKISEAIKNHKLITYRESLTSSDKIELDVSDIKQNYTFSFTAKIPDDFSSLKLGHGINALYSGMYVEITSQEVKFYRYHSSDILVNSFTHGLNIQSFINVTVRVLQDQSSEVIVNTLSGSFKCSNKWQGSKDTIAAQLHDCTLSDCTLSYYCSDYDKKIWAFGDSYFYDYSTDRWPKIVIDNGFTGAMFDGFGGRTSAQALISLNKCLLFGCPDTILWCMGMNDSDKDSCVNDGWQNTLDTVRSICEQNNIRLVLCTIPTTPTNNHNYKNEIIKNSGLEYIDIADALGADGTGGWYDGCLSADNIHPTAKGNKVIAAKIMSDMPEMLK